MPTIPGDDAVAVTRRSALSHIARGWPVFLLSTDDSDKGKHPTKNCPRCDLRSSEYVRHDKELCECLLCHAFYAATLDPARFEQMLAVRPGGYLAIRTGTKSRLLVLDVEAEGLEMLDGVNWGVITGDHSWVLPPTLMARSVSGGLHLFYELPPGVIVKPGRIVKDLDIKAEGGYVVAVGSRSGKRTWVDETVQVAPASPELLNWLATTKRLGPGGRGGGSGGSGSPDGYDYQRFCRDGCPDGHREYFFNDLIFRGRVQQGLDHSELTEFAYDHWLRVAQPPDARYEMLWEDVEYKVDRIVVEHEPNAAVEHLWPGVLQPRADAVGPEPTNVIGGPPSFIADLTQTGNAHRFVRLFRDQALFIPGIGWHMWTGNLWQLDDLDDVFDGTQRVLLQLRREQAAAAGNDEQENRVRRFYDISSGIGARRAMLEGAAADPRMKTSADRLNVDPYALVVENGTLDLRTQRLRESQSSDLNTQVAAVRYDMNAHCPRWLEHVRLITQRVDGTADPVLSAFIQRWAGYTLTGLVREQKFFFGFGGGDNGKNVFIETLMGLMGTYAIRGSTKILLGGGQEHETVIADLAGTRMVFIDETPHGRMNEARLKELTGSSRIRARKIAKDSFEFDARFKLWIAGNNKPRVLDTTKGFWRRLDLVPFDAMIPIEQRQVGYGDVLKAEWSGILNWALEGLRDYLELGTLGQPERVLVASRDYRAEENVFEQFVSECFDTGTVEPVWQPNNVLHAVYKRWCEEHGLKTLSMQQLSNDWREQHFERDDKTKKIKQGYPRSVKVQRGYVGPPLRVTVPSELAWDGMPKILSVDGEGAESNL